MEAGAGNSILHFETLFSDFQEILNGSSLTPRLTAQLPHRTLCSTSCVCLLCPFLLSKKP